MLSRAASKYVPHWKISIIQKVVNILERENDVISKTTGCGPISRHYYGI